MGGAAGSRVPSTAGTQAMSQMQGMQPGQSQAYSYMSGQRNTTPQLPNEVGTQYQPPGAPQTGGGFPLPTAQPASPTMMGQSGQQMPYGLQNLMDRFNGMSQLANLPQQSMISRMMFNPSAPSDGYAAARPPQNFAPQIRPTLPTQAAPQANQALSDRDMQELADYRARFGQSYGGGGGN